MLHISLFPFNWLDQGFWHPIDQGFWHPIDQGFWHPVDQGFWHPKIQFCKFYRVQKIQFCRFKHTVLQSYREKEIKQIIGPIIFLSDIFFNLLIPVFRQISDTFPTQFREISDTFPTHVRHISDTFSTHVRHISDTCSTHFRHMFGNALDML